MNILVLAPYARPWDSGDVEGGEMNTFIRKSCEALSKHHNVTVFIRASRETDPNVSKKHNNLTLRCISAGEKKRLPENKVFQACKQHSLQVDDLERFDVIIAHYWISEAWARQLNDRFSGKILYVSHSSFVNSYRDEPVSYVHFESELRMLQTATWCATADEEDESIKRITSSDSVVEIPQSQESAATFSWESFVTKIEDLVMQPTTVYSGKVMRISKIPREINNRVVPFEHVELSGSVHVFPVDEQDNVWLIREQRAEEGGISRTKVLSGVMEAGEEPEYTAHRELREEVGMQAAELIPLVKTGETGAITDARYYYVARKLTFGETKHEDTELIEDIFAMDIEELFQFSLYGGFGSSITGVAVNALYVMILHGYNPYRNF